MNYALKDWNDSESSVDWLDHHPIDNDLVTLREEIL